VADFFLDADIDDHLVDLLHNRGHSALTTDQASRYNASDDEQLLVATDLNRTLITHDKRDYVLLYRAWRTFAHHWQVEPGNHAGVLIVPQSQIIPYSTVASEIHSLVRQTPGLRGRIFELNVKWGWVERP
jgi:hypothetical protein